MRTWLTRLPTGIDPKILQAKFTSWWKLDEASGTRNDELAAANHLTDNATVTQAVGKVGNAAQFTLPNSEYLSHADNASLSTGDIGFLLCLWAYLDTKATSQVFISQVSATSYGYDIHYNVGADRFRLEVGDGATTMIGIVTANSLGSPSVATWYFIVGWHDPTANKVYIQVNDGAVDEAATTGAAGDSSSEFDIGRQVAGNFFVDGRIDEVGFAKNLLTADERSYLYNTSSGRTIPL